MSLSILSIFSEKRIYWTSEISVAQGPQSMKAGFFCKFVHSTSLGMSALLHGEHKSK